MKKTFKASEAAQGLAWAKQQQEKTERKANLIARLEARSEHLDDIWAEMAREARAAEA